MYKCSIIILLIYVLLSMFNHSEKYNENYKDQILICNTDINHKIYNIATQHNSKINFIKFNNKFCIKYQFNTLFFTTKVAVHKFSTDLEIYVNLLENCYKLHFDKDINITCVYNINTILGCNNHKYKTVANNSLIYLLFDFVKK